MYQIRYEKNVQNVEENWIFFILELFVNVLDTFQWNRWADVPICFFIKENL